MPKYYDFELDLQETKVLEPDDSTAMWTGSCREDVCFSEAWGGCK